MSTFGMGNQFSQFSGLGTGSQFPDPFNDIASTAMPTNMRSALRWSEFIFSSFGTYRTAIERIISYFLTSVEVGDATDEEKEKWENFFNGPIDLMTVIQSRLRNRSCYGNCFASLVVPFKRMLQCPKCGYMVTLKTIAENKVYGFKFVMGEPERAFHATCPSCKVGSGYSGPWHLRDQEDDNETKLKIKLWNPHEMEMLHCPYTDEVSYLWRIPEDYKNLIRRGHLFHLERVPKEVLRAIARNQLYRFHEDAIHHMKEPTLAGIYNRGWGLSRVLTNFRQIWYVQVLRRFNEAIALDYVIPFRIITPAPAQGKTTGGLPIDPLAMFNGSDFKGQVNSMIRRRRRDPASLQVLPFPVNFQMFGADAKQLAPRELLDQGIQTLLNDVGSPIEFYNGTLNIQTSQPALRLYESQFRHLVHDTDSFITWLVRQVCQVMGWEEIDASLQKVTIADNLEEKMMAAQLMMSQQLSGTTVLNNMGYNWKKEQRTISEEAQYQAQLQSRAQEEMDQAGFAQQIAKGQMAGGQGGPGQPAQGQGDPSQAQGQAAGQPGMMPGQGPVTQYLASMTPNTPQTPDDMLKLADSLAQQLLGLPEGVKDSELRLLKNHNEALHSMVRARMDAIRRNVKQQGGNSAMAQMQGGGAQMAA